MSLRSGGKETTKLLHTAIENGINFFDTADLYNHGENEIWLGEGLKGKRHQVYISTKVGNQWKKDRSGWIWNPRKEYILKQVDASLQRLQTDYLDLYQLHGGTIEDPIDEIIETFEHLQQTGKIKFYGISSIRPDFIKQMVRRSNISSVMLQYSLLDRRPEEEVLPLLRQHSIGVLARGSLAKGILTGKPPYPYLEYTTEQLQQLQHHLSKFKKSEEDVSPALSFVLSNPAVTTAVAGIGLQKHLEAIVQGALRIEQTPADELRSLFPVTNYKEHR